MMIAPIRPMTPSNRISFGYKWKVKDLWKAGDLPTVTKGFYGDTLTKKNISIEHLVPHSKGGPTISKNLVLASKAKNNARSNFDIRGFVDEKTAMEYLDQFVGIKKKGFDGNKYIESILQTLKNLGVDLMKKS